MDAVGLAHPRETEGGGRVRHRLPLQRRSAMPARSGQDYLNGLQEQEREIWLGGERVKDVTTHPGLRHGAQAIASLYDMQHDLNLRDEMTYISPTTGDRVGLSFIIPRTMQELEQRRAMMLHWARTTCGMMGRAPCVIKAHLSSSYVGADNSEVQPPMYLAGGGPRQTKQHVAPLLQIGKE